MEVKKLQLAIQNLNKIETFHIQKYFQIQTG